MWCVSWGTSMEGEGPIARDISKMMAVCRQSCERDKKGQRGHEKEETRLKETKPKAWDACEAKGKKGWVVNWGIGR